MPFDTFVMAAVRDELCNAALGGQIQRIIQPSAPTVSISVYASGRVHWLVLSADARYARVHLSSERLAKGFATPSSFIMLLRKYLEGSRLTEVQQQPYERVLRLSCGGAEHGVTLIAEVMGKHSNIVLVDTDDTVLGALKIISSRQSRVRPIAPGVRYAPPPGRPRDVDLFGRGERIDPSISPQLFSQLLDRAAAGTPVQKALMGLLPGASPLLTRDIAARAHADPHVPLADVSVTSVQAEAAALYQLYRTRQWDPCTFVDDRGSPDFAAFVPRSARDPIRLSAISAAVEVNLGRDESRDSLGVSRQALLKQVDHLLHGARHRLTSLHQGLEASQAAEIAMQRGQLVLAYQYLVPPRADRLTIPDLDLEIPLDPNLSPTENAEKLFRRYKKLRDARVRIPELLKQAETEVGRLDDLAAFVRLAGSEAELRELERALDPPGLEKAPVKRRDKRRGPPRYELDRCSLTVGRNARENEEVTFRLARRDDVWLHARGRTGAHVILHCDSDSPSEAIVLAAAGVAAFFSEGRNDTAVDVDVARVRDVRKIPGGPPGRVTFRGERTVRAVPGLGDWLPSAR